MINYIKLLSYKIYFVFIQNKIKKKILSLASKKNDSIVILIDFANSSKKSVNENTKLKKYIIKRYFSYMIYEILFKYVKERDVYIIKRKADQVELLFFDSYSADNFIKEFLYRYEINLLPLMDKFNLSRTVKNSLYEKLFIKIYCNKITLTQEIFDNHFKINFDKNDSYKDLFLIEKPIKTELSKTIHNIDKYFIVYLFSVEGLKHYKFSVDDKVYDYWFKYK